MPGALQPAALAAWMPAGESDSSATTSQADAAGDDAGSVPEAAMALGAGPRDEGNEQGEQGARLHARAGTVASLVKAETGELIVDLPEVCQSPALD